MQTPMNQHIIIAQKAEGRKEEIESLRNIPDDIIHEVKKAGLVKKWAAKEYGGQESSVENVTDMIQSISYHNGSLAWVIAVTGCSSLFSGYLKEGQARSLFADDKAMIGGFAGPAGMAVKTEKGLLVNGRWSWGSGISHCSHIVGGVALMEEGRPIGTALIFMRPGEVTMHDNWHVLGLKGSHSVDYSVKDLVIPDDRWSMFPLKEAVIDAPIYRFSFLGALSMSVASVGLGLAKRAIDEIEALAKVKSPFGFGKKLSERAIFQKEFAILNGQYKAATALFSQTIREGQAEVEQGLCSSKSKGAIRLASCHAIQMCTSVVNGAYQLGGGSAIRESSKLEEIMRDMNVVSQHGMVAPGNYRTVGALMLGNQVPEQML